MWPAFCRPAQSKNIAAGGRRIFLNIKIWPADSPPAFNPRTQKNMKDSYKNIIHTL